VIRSPCSEMRELLPWFVGGDLSDAECARVREHLVACLPCRREAASLQQAGAALRGLASAPALGVDDAMFLGLQREVLTAVAGSEPGRGPRRSWWRPALASAAALLLVGVGFVVGGSWGDRRDSVWERSALSPAGPAVDGTGPSARLPWALRPLGIESWQRLEDAEVEREAAAECFPAFEGDREPDRILRSNGLSVRLQLRSLVKTRLASDR
jgi:Putative zinc-finger